MLHRIVHRSSVVAAVLAAAAIAHSGALAQDAKPAGPPGVQGEILVWIQDAEDKLVQLAEAMPESKYGWSPDKFDTFEHSLTKKVDIIKALKDSFAHMEGALKTMSDADMDKPAEFFGLKTTGRGAYLLMLSHAHEHLGQSIAYARSNKVTPPWTAKEQAAEASSKKK
jgi:hypothetical protein